MPGSEALLVGALLGLADASGARLELEVWLSRSATAALSWGAERIETGAPRIHHRFGPLPWPADAPTRWRLELPGGGGRSGRLPPVSGGRLRVAAAGITGADAGPEAELGAAIAAWDPHLVLLTAPVEDRSGLLAWTARLGRPVLFAPGSGGPREAPPLLRLGPLTIVSPPPDAARLADDPSSARSSGPRIALAARGPLGSSGAASPDESRARAWADAGVTAVLSGSRPGYERLGRGRTAFVVTGPGSDPATTPRRALAGSVGWVPVPHWVAMTVDERALALVARSLEGLRLDAARLPPEAPWAVAGSVAGLVVALLALALGAGLAIALILRG